MEATKFNAKIDEALAVVRRILDNTRNPELATGVRHEYDDKYVLAEFVTNSTLAAALNALDTLGLSDESARKLKEWSATSAVSLACEASMTCVFDREETRKEESKSQHVREHKGTFGGLKVTDKVVTTIHEYFWKVTLRYELFAYAGTNVAERVPIRQKSGACEVMTSSDKNPYSKEHQEKRREVDITWLLQHLGDDLTLRFSIDRSAKRCHTPRRNEDVAGALRFFRALSSWADSVRGYLTNTVFPIQQKHALDMAGMESSGLFVPVAPLFEKRDGGEERPGLSIADLNAFLGHQRATVAEKFATLAKVYPADGKLITNADAEVVVLMKHVRDVLEMGEGGVDFIERMLRDQLIAGIGKVVTPVDFTEYMAFHNRKLFKPEFEPAPFCHAVRRPDHYPEGILSIEQMKNDGTVAEPVVSVVRHTAATAPMRFPLDASSNIEFWGDRYVHGWIGHQFSSDTGSSMKLVARARQFSNYIVLVGRIGGPGLFEPKHAMIVQNKDELTIPIELETIPTPKEFADAIESLSPEQQRFAKAIRSMQLEGTVFGVVVIQIKPQLERLLNLHDDSLTKEIRLTTDLLDLFMQYQIPSDLLSFDGPDGTGPADRVEAVRGHVRAILDMIQMKKDEELAAELQRKAYAEAQLRLQEEQKRAKEHEEYRRNVKQKEMNMGLKRAKPQKKRMMRSAAPASVMQSAAPMRQAAAPMGMSAAPSPAPVVAQPKPSPAAPAPEPAPPAAADAPAEQKTPSLEAAGGEADGGEDYTQLPVQLDAKLGELDVDNAVRPTIINTSKAWSLKFHKTLLSDEESRALGADEQKTEKNKAYDLLDALTRSGVLPVQQASLHVVIAATHCFDKTLVDTVVQDNVNPIEKVERTSLIMATVVHQCEAAELVKPAQLDRVKKYSAMLFDGE